MSTSNRDRDIHHSEKLGLRVDTYGAKGMRWTSVSHSRNALQRFVNDFRICLDEWDEGRSEFGVVTFELNRESGKDGFQIAFVFEISGAEGGT